MKTVFATVEQVAEYAK
jgi:cytochrome b involved in lipid metabolism